MGLLRAEKLHEADAEDLEMEADSGLPLTQCGVVDHPILLQARDGSFPELLADHAVEKHLWIVDIGKTNSLRCIAVVGQLSEWCRRLHQLLSMFELHGYAYELLAFSFRSEGRL